jgi:RNA polymerase sigma factor (TIGR02999 family)
MNPSDVTQLLAAAERGDFDAADRLLPVVYDELRRLAGQKLAGERAGHTLQATALVHEAYIRLLGNDQSWEGRRHFFGAAAEAMRRILVESARRKQSQKRGGGVARADVELTDIPATEPDVDVLALNEALEKLAQQDAAAAEIVKLRYFAGLSIPEAAEVLNVSPRSADRLWAYARAWLHREVVGG